MVNPATSSSDTLHGEVNPVAEQSTEADVLELQERRRRLQQQHSTVWTRRQHAVCVRRACKRYGNAKNPNVILENLNMTVPKGTIYGLLGASGCGKTTLLSCIVGRRRLNSGEIWVLGGRPGSRGSGVPGPRIGYMPQEIALYGEFTIRETLLYFGWIAGKTTQYVDKKLEFLIQFLMLPPSSRLVSALSGGQQRRVSLAAALVHEPELLILDEPTVGVDPVLRQNIWDHLVAITKDGSTTVIITTHYIDETRQAGMIGLMRGGRFLAEESPADLMAKHGCESLEDVFLKLSKMQNLGRRRRSSYMQEIMASMPAPPDLPDMYDSKSEISGEYGDNISISNKSAKDVEPTTSPPPDLPLEEEPPLSCKDFVTFMSPSRLKALIWKNLLWMFRNYPVMAFIFGLPILEIALFCLTIGRDPKGLHIAVVNKELNNTLNGCIAAEGCVEHNLGCKYIDHLRAKHYIMDLYDDFDEAVDAVAKGYAWGTIYFPSNYSSSFLERVDKGKDAEDFILDFSNIVIKMDMSNQQIGQLLLKDIHAAFEEFANDLLIACNYSAKVASLPIQFKTPIYGSSLPNFRDFAAPGVILTIIFFLALALTSGAMLIERNEGMLERCLVSGVTSIELLTSHLTTQFFVMAIQTVVVLLFSFPVFGIEIQGNWFSVTVLVLLTGLAGMCFGFVVSCVTNDERSATYLGLGSFLPMILLSGIIWPVEGMHRVLKYFSYILPLTQSTESMRGMLARGWDISNPRIYLGYISTLIWICIYLTTSILLLKFKKG